MLTHTKNLYKSYRLSVDKCPFLLYGVSMTVKPKPKLNFLNLKRTPEWFDLTRITIRVPKRLVPKLAEMAKAWGISQNQLYIFALIKLLVLHTSFDRRWLYNLGGLLRTKELEIKKRIADANPELDAPQREDVDPLSFL